MNIKKLDKTKVSATKLRLFEAFAGIGAQRKALTNLGIDYEIVGMAEWFIPAIVSYQAIHNNFSKKNIKKRITKEKMIEFLDSLPLSMNSKSLVKKGYWKRLNDKDLRVIYHAVKLSKEEGNIFDVRRLHKRGLKDIDLLTYSFPCQDLSQQGKQKGFGRNKSTRSGLLWEIEKALDVTDKKDLPKYLLMENVSSLLNKTFKDDFKEWTNKLEKLGYKNSVNILNSADFGSPQARRRVFMISTLNEKIELPIGKQRPRVIKTILNKDVEEKDFLSHLEKYEMTGFRETKSNINKASLIGYTTFNSENYIYDPKFTGPTLTASGANSRIKIHWNNRIRKMNAKEAYQYMGFTKSDYNKVNNLDFLNETKMIYTCGNSIVVEVLEAIFKEVQNGK